MVKPACICLLALATLGLLAPLPFSSGQEKTATPTKKTGPAAKKKTTAPERIQEMVVNDALTPDLPMDTVRTGCYHKVHLFRMDKGSTYTIDLVSSDFDAFLRIEDSKGKQLAADDDSGGGRNARIIFTPPATDEYRLIATTFGAGQQGHYTLSAKQGRQPLLATPGGVTIAVPGIAPQPVPFGDLTITSEPPQNPVPAHGYVEYRFHIHNKANEPHHVQLVMPQNSHGYGIYLRSVSRAVDVGPQTDVVVSLFQPDIPMPGNGVQVIIDGRPRRELLPIGSQVRGQLLNVFGGHSSYQATVLVSASQSNNGVQFHWGKAGFVAPPPRAAAMSGFQFTLAQPADPSSMNWLSYSGYDGIVVSSSDLTARGPAVQAALEQYVECGGSLLVVGPWKGPKPWERTRSAGPGLTRFYPGFGECINIDEPTVGKWSVDQMRAVTTSWQQSGVPWLDLRTPTEANKLFPVVEHLNVPVRGMFVLMLVFSVLIGPVNLYVLARTRRRLWLLWTVPVISLVTCLAVLGYMFAVEGWEGHVRSESFTVLDETSHQAATLGWIAFYTPVVPSDGLHFSPETELTPQARTVGFVMNSRPRTMDWTEDQHLTSGWLTARVPAHFVVRKAERRLERVTVSKGKDGALTMVNGLKGDIHEIRFMSAQGGKVYAASNVPAGQQAVLKAAGAIAPEEEDVLRRIYRGQWLDGMRRATEHPEAVLRPGCYVAILEATPFLEDGLSRPGHRQGHSVVFGVMKEPIGE